MITSTVEIKIMAVIIIIEIIMPYLKKINMNGIIELFNHFIGFRMNTASNKKHRCELKDKIN